MNTKQNQFNLDFDGETLTIRINGKLVVAYPRRDLAKPVREVLFLYMESLIIGPPPGVKESFDDKIVGFQIPSRALARCVAGMPIYLADYVTIVPTNRPNQPPEPTPAGAVSV